MNVLFRFPTSISFLEVFFALLEVEPVLNRDDPKINQLCDVRLLGETTDPNETRTEILTKKKNVEHVFNTITHYNSFKSELSAQNPLAEKR